MIPPNLLPPAFLRAFGKLFLALGLAAVLLTMGYVAIAAPNATIQLSAEPGTSVAIKPTENEYISWIITPSVGKPPNRTEFIIYNQNGDILYSKTYTAPDGIDEDYIYTLPATYTVPAGLPFEQYVAQIDYYSASGWEAEAKAAFFVSQDTGALKIIKFDDKNLNGQQDQGEPPVPGVTFRIQFPPPFTNTIFITQTDRNGQILYPQLGTGAYTVTEITPPGSIPTNDDVQVAIVEKDMTATVAFGNATIPGGIEIFKFHDHNGNGLRDAEDGPLKGVRFDASARCGQTATGVSDNNGYVRWTHRCVGEWTITETVPSNFRATTPIVVNTSVTSGVTSTVSFGNQGLGKLTVIKFEDKNGNGVQDSGEPPWPGVSMTYTNEYGDVASCTTDANGLCTFPDVPEGVYTVTEKLPHNTQAVKGQVLSATLGAGETVTVTFANRKLGALSPHVFWDIDGDGVQDANEPDQPGFTIYYRNEYGETGADQSDSNGDVLWRSLAVGTYTTTLALTNGCAATTKNPQVDDVIHAKTTYMDFGYRCMLYLPLVIKDWPAPTPTPTATPAPTNTPTPTATPTPPPPIIPVIHPKTIAIDDANNVLYVSSLTTNKLYVIDGGHNTVTHQIPVGATPYGVDINPSTRKAYVANVKDDSVSVIDMDANAVIATISLDAGSRPMQVAVNPDTNKVYVTLHGSNRLAVIDGATDAVTKTIPDLPGAFDVIVNRPDNHIYVSARDAHFISVIDGASDEQAAKIVPGGETYALAFDPGLKQLYTIIDPDGPLYLLDHPQDGVHPPLPDLIEDDEPNPNTVIIFEVKPNYDFGRRGYLLAGKAGPQGGVGIAANPTTGNFFISNAADNTLTVFDGATLITHATLAMEGDPGDVAVNPVTNRVYVSNRAADVVHMIIDGW